MTVYKSKRFMNIRRQQRTKRRKILYLKKMCKLLPLAIMQLEKNIYQIEQYVISYKKLSY
jgi:hypothetical protein